MCLLHVLLFVFCSSSLSVREEVLSMVLKDRGLKCRGDTADWPVTDIIACLNTLESTQVCVYVCAHGVKVY